MDYSIIPGNITHNWDFEQRLVSRQSLQEINLFYERPVIKLEHKNAKLFVFVQKLGSIKRTRNYLILMKKYLDVCKIALAEKLVEKTVGARRYLFDSMDFYSLYDLVCVENTSLNDYLNNVFKIFKSHIASCVVSCSLHFCELLLIYFISYRSVLLKLFCVKFVETMRSCIHFKKGRQHAKLATIAITVLVFKNWLINSVQNV